MSLETIPNRKEHIEISQFMALQSTMTINLQATFMAATSAIFFGPAYPLLQGLVVFWQIDMKSVEGRMIPLRSF